MQSKRRRGIPCCSQVVDVLHEHLAARSLSFQHAGQWRSALLVRTNRHRRHTVGAFQQAHVALKAIRRHSILTSRSRYAGRALQAGEGQLRLGAIALRRSAEDRAAIAVPQRQRQRETECRQDPVRVTERITRLDACFDCGLSPDQSLLKLQLALRRRYTCLGSGHAQCRAGYLGAPRRQPERIGECDRHFICRHSRDRLQVEER